MIPEEETVGAERRLVKMLREIWDNDNFVLGVRLRLKTDEEREEVMQAYEDGDLLDSDDVLLFALDIHQDREGTAQEA
ncbi:hypothetical protein HMPREF1147_1324 [Selenomonas sp. FOBRC9]|uniref:hypothetical protein n=1 Tax=Selenomonas sp. FOBRC9 TaxID=936573 RepID=UPI00027A6051|nr:hypothetical protein [Selenomonas sp. FOBRC9]EJP32320.1 hypothetical protein HMPREF1147_1324 [Selenomonas sp. FOBRC9]